MLSGRLLLLVGHGPNVSRAVAAGSGAARLGRGGRSAAALQLSCHQPTSRQAPAFQPIRRLTPTGSKPRRSWRATLASLGRVMPAQATWKPWRRSRSKSSS